MKDIQVYNLNGEEVGKVELLPGVFAVPANDVLVHQVALAQMANVRENLAKTKDRSEVRGGGRKPWQQKGTGRARHGSSRSPIWRKGGVTFGPTSLENYGKKVNKKSKKLALNIVLSGKVKDDQLIVVDSFKLEQPKTKLVAAAFKNLRSKVGSFKESKMKDKIIIALGVSEKESTRAMKNISNFSSICADSLNVVDLLSNKYLIVTKEALEIIQNR